MYITNLFILPLSQDLCANSPKDYTQNALKQKSAFDVNNKSIREAPQIGKYLIYFEIYNLIFFQSLNI